MMNINTMSNVDVKFYELTDADLEAISAAGSDGSVIGGFVGAAVGCVVGGLVAGPTGAASCGGVGAIAGGRIGGGLEDKVKK